MKLGYIVLRPKQKYSPSSGLQRGEPAPNEAKTIFSAGKVMATVFRNSHGVILIDYLQMGKNHYRSLRRIITLQAERSTCGKTATFAEKENPVLPRQRTVPFHTSAVAMAKIHKLRFDLLDHPSCSPDLVLSDFFLFPHLKIALR